MKTYLDCYPCFFSQAVKTSRIITSDDKKIRQVLDAVAEFLPGVCFEATPPEIGREVYRIISEITGVADPYQKIKEECTRQALSLYPELKKKVDDSQDRLMVAVKVAIAGNIIDFGANADFDLRNDIETILSQDFGINHYKEFCEGLEGAKKVLYLADNAGETVFDRILIEEIQKPVIYVVREKPVINDAVRKDALEAGIDNVAEIISSGCDAPGTILKLCSSEFMKVYRSADFVISKGQGNYEGLSGEARPIFFLLKTKCAVIARDIGVEKGHIILMKAGRENIY